MCMYVYLYSQVYKIATFTTRTIIKQNGIIMFTGILLVSRIFFTVSESTNTMKQLSRKLKAIYSALSTLPNTVFKILILGEVFKLILFFFFFTFVNTFSHSTTSYLYSHMYESVCGRLCFPNLSVTTKLPHTSFFDTPSIER